ncbi:MAG: BatD family protein [Bacteroidales bacterium]
MKHFLVVLLLLAGYFVNTTAQVTFKASANNMVEVGENFRLNFTVNANCTGFVPPSLTDFNVLAGPSTSTSSSFQFINGKTSQTLIVTFSYIIQARKEGKYTIGKAQVTVDGKVYSTEPITIEAIKASGNQNTANDDEFQSTPAANDGDIFIQINLNKTTVYQGEHLIATLKVYDRAGLKAFQDYKFPSYTGFWSQDIQQPQQISLDRRENVNGKIYSTGVLKQSILFPQQSGKLTIDPFELECVVQQKVGRRRNFFGEMVDVYNDVVKNLKSTSRTVNVLPLPDNKPTSFTGAVGTDFKFDIKVDRTELKSNESLTLKATVSGNGNLKIIDKINIQFPNTFEIYDPKITNNISNTEAGSRGTNTYEYLVIPREPGNFTIPGLQFSYFDVNSKTYKTLTTKEINLVVSKGENNQLITSGTAISKEDVQTIGSDIRHIYEGHFLLEKKNSNFFGSTVFVLSYLFSALVFILLMVFLRKRIKQNQNLALIKNKRANKISKKRLKEAEKHMKSNNKEAFYNEVIRALWGYLGDKLNIQLAELSREKAKETLLKQNIDAQIVTDFIEVIDNCEFAKYAPVSVENQIANDYEKARKIINKLVEALS